MSSHCSMAVERVWLPPQTVYGKSNQPWNVPLPELILSSEFSFESLIQWWLLTPSAFSLNHKTQQPLCHQRFIPTVTLCVFVPDFVQRYAVSICPSAWAVTVYLVNSLLLVTNSMFCYLFQQEFCAPSPPLWPPQDSIAICPNCPLTWPAVSDSCVWPTLLLGISATG